MSVHISTLVSFCAVGAYPTFQFCRSGRSCMGGIPSSSLSSERIFKATVNCLFDVGRFATHLYQEHNKAKPTTRRKSS